MADRGIIFSGPMILALLAGRKSCTRRIIKGLGDEIDNVGDGESVVDLATGKVVHMPYAAGDRLYVREAWACHWATDDQAPRDIDPDLWSVRYLADDTIKPAARDGSTALLEQCRKGRPSIFMPRWASRLWLAVDDVRIERLHEITREECVAEGHPEPPWQNFSEDARLDAARDWFVDLWDDLHGKKPGESWADNPWIVRTGFTVHKGNLDV